MLFNEGPPYAMHAYPVEVLRERRKDGCDTECLALKNLVQRERAIFSSAPRDQCILHLDASHLLNRLLHIKNARTRFARTRRLGLLQYSLLVHHYIVIAGELGVQSIGAKTDDSLNPADSLCKARPRVALVSGSIDLACRRPEVNPCRM